MQVNQAVIPGNSGIYTKDYEPLSSTEQNPNVYLHMKEIWFSGKPVCLAVFTTALLKLCFIPDWRGEGNQYANPPHHPSFPVISCLRVSSDFILPNESLVCAKHYSRHTTYMTRCPNNKLWGRDYAPLFTNEMIEAQHREFCEAPKLLNELGSSACPPESKTQSPSTEPRCPSAFSLSGFPWPPYHPPPNSHSLILPLAVFPQLLGKV